MSEYKYLSANTPQDALRALFVLRENACLVAGGTNVLVEMRQKRHAGKTLLSIRDIGAYKGVGLENGRVRIGALTPVSELLSSGFMEKEAPALFMAARVFADPVTRNTATVGGNAANGSPAADLVPALMALGATVHVRSLRGEREIPIAQFYKGYCKTALAAEELIEAFSFSPAKSGYMKLGLRKAMSISVATAAAAAELNDDGTIKWCRIALGAVAENAVRALEAERVLTGEKPDEAAFEAMAEAIQKDISPIDDIRASAIYRRSVAPVLAKRALKAALYGCCGEEEAWKS